MIPAEGDTVDLGESEAPALVRVSNVGELVAIYGEAGQYYGLAFRAGTRTGARTRLEAGAKTS